MLPIFIAETEEPVGEENYWLIVGGVQVKESNKDNIPAFPDGQGSASFDPETRTLTLKDVTGFKGAYDTKKTETGKTYIYSLYGDLTIEGNMDVKAAWPEVDSVIAVDGGAVLSGNFKIEGDDCDGIALTDGSGIKIAEGTTLEIIGNTYKGISGKGNVVVSGGTVKIITEAERPLCGIDARGFKMTDGIVDIKGHYCGISITDGNISISGGKVSVEGRTVGITMDAIASNTFNVSGGELTAKGYNGYGVKFEGKGNGSQSYHNGKIDLNFTGGKITAIGGSYGIYGDYTEVKSAGNQNLIIDGADVTVEGTEDDARGIQVSGKFIVNSGKLSVKGKDGATFYNVSGPDLSEEATVELVKPAGGRAGDHNILDDKGNIATEVLIVEKTKTDYPLWVDGKQVNSLNKGDILKDGKASFDPATNTLTFKDATISEGYEYNTSAKRGAGVYAKGSDLTIKGNLIVDGTTINDAICVEDTAVNGRKLVLDGNITLKGDYGINTKYAGVEINGGNLEIDVTTSAVKAGAPVSLANGMKVLSPEGAEFRKSTVGEVYYLYESADSNVQVKKATIGSSSVAENYTVTFDLNGKIGTAPAAQTVEKGKTVSKPSDPSAEGLKFVAWCTDKEGKNVYDFATPVTADITLYAKWVEASADTFTVTFVLNGKSGTAPAAQTVEKGKTVSKPADPKADGFVFKAWCTDKEGKKEYDFSTPVTANITLYAKWEKAEEPVPGPDPIDGGKSALDPVPELIPGVTKDLYLVKGQKFNIGQGWYVDKADKDSKKRVSISKKGAFKAKAEGEAVIKCGSGAEAWEVKLHISKPKMDKKSLKIQLETETEVKTEKIGFTYDKDNLDVLWYSANPDVVTVDDSGNVTTVGKGSSKVTAYINGSAYTCTVTVKEKAALLERTLHVAKGATKTISIKGLEKPQWEESVMDIVSVKKNKVTGLNAGTTVLSFTQDEKVYKVTVIVEDLTMSGTGLKAQGKPGSNKYIIDELKAKDETILSFAGVTQSVVFKSSKPDIAFIDEDLNVVIRNKGKAKFTVKINGKPVTISVNIK